MKYLKYFQEDSEYTQFKNNSDYVLPNVSYVVLSESVFFNPNLTSEVVSLDWGGYYPEVGAKLQEIWNKYGTKLGIDKSNHTMQVGLDPDNGRFYIECPDTEPWSYLDSEEEMFFKSIQIHSLNFSSATFSAYTIQITCCSSDNYCEGREMDYEGHVLDQPDIS